MGLYKRAGSVVWWCRFQVAGREIKRSTRTTDRRAAEIEERRIRAYYEAQAPSRRSSRAGDLAELAGLDVERAAAAGATKQHQEALAWVWGRIVDHFGAEAEPRVITFDSVQAYIARRRETGASDTIAREVQALKRACIIAHRKGWLAYVPPEWPKVRRGARSAKRRGRLHPPEILSAWLRELPTDARDEADVVLLTGLRASEAKRIEAGWIEPAPSNHLGIPAVLRVPAASAKDREERLVGLPARALEVLKRRAELVAPGAPLLYQGSHWTAYRLARQRIGYQTPISLRDLRHTWGTLANRLVGIDAARDGLGHSNVATTNRYVSGELGRVLAASAAVESATSRHSNAAPCAPVQPVVDAQPCESVEHSAISGRSSVGQSISLPSRDRACLEHLSTCPACTLHVQACLKWTENDGPVGTGEPAHTTARRA